jgi:hypothetical protein
MNNKTMLAVLAVLVVAVSYLGWKSMTLSAPNTNTSGISLSTDPSPLRPGRATFMIDVKDTNGKPVDGATVSFDINMTAMNMGTQRGTATSQGNGRYSAVGNMSMRGPWRVATSVKMPDGSTESKDFTVNVP